MDFWSIIALCSFVFLIGTTVGYHAGTKDAMVRKDASYHMGYLDAKTGHASPYYDRQTNDHQ